MVFSGGLSTRESDVLGSDGSDEVDTKLYRPIGLSCSRCFLVIEIFVVVFPLVVPLVYPLTHSLEQLLVHSLAVSLVLLLASSLVHW